MMQERGIGLLELMLVLAVLTVLALSAVRYVETTRQVSRQADAVGVVQILINATEDWQRANKGFENISYIGLQGRGLIPALTHSPWGGAIHVIDVGGGQVKFVLDGVPRAECENLSDVLTKKQVSGSCLPTGGYEGVYSGG